MNQTLKDFIVDWNESHNRFILSAQVDPARCRPVEVSIRYSAARYQDFYSTNKWNELRCLVEAKSHGTMYVVTDEYLFERGIIDIKVASSNHNYEEQLVVGVLMWIGEKFFPSNSKTS